MAQAADTALPGLNVLMVCDYFYPNQGGVENHVYHVAQGLIRRGHNVAVSPQLSDDPGDAVLWWIRWHQVVVLTHQYAGGRKGVRYMTCGMKVYYAPRLAFDRECTLPTVLGAFSLMRSVIVRERIQLVHAHQAFSTLAHEAVLHARTMRLKTVFTDHSLFGFADGSSIHTNKLLQFTLCDTQQVVCVSHTSKENTVLRSHVPPERVSVIPNAVDTARFVPDVSAQPLAPTVTIVVMSRLVYRKGVDLLLELIPAVCSRFPHVRFVVGGDGPKFALLVEMRETHGLQQRVELLGQVAHVDVCDVLNRGHIFLNMSLTETFCIALLEAASCGLLVVSTCVGGVPEVLPPEMLVLAEPNPAGLMEAVAKALDMLPQIQPLELHAAVRRMYSWTDICARLERVYALALRTHSDDLLPRLARFYRCGLVAGKLFCCVVVVEHLYGRWLDWWRPKREIDLAPKFRIHERAGEVM